jgi:hypothetical protein
MVYSDNVNKIFWEMFIAVLLILVCLIIPFRLALDLDLKVDPCTGVPSPKQDHVGLNGWEIFLYLCDSFFFLDLVIQFFSTYLDTEKMLEVEDRKLIAQKYFKTWFLIDFVSIVPFDRFVHAVTETISNNKSNTLIRVTKIGKIYKLVRLMRLVKILKLMKNKDKINNQLQK